MKSILTVFKYIGTVIGSILLLLLVVLGLLHLPSVQTKLANYLANRIDKVSEYNTEIGRLEIDWFDQISLFDVSITKEGEDPLATVDTLFVNYQLKTLFVKNKLSLDSVYLNGGTIRLFKEADDSTNLSKYLADIDEVFGSKKEKKTPGAPIVSVEAVGLKNLNFIYNDLTLKDSLEGTRQVDFANLNLQDITLNAQKIYVQGDTVQADIQGLTLYEEHSKFRLDSLTTNFRMDSSFMEFSPLYLAAGKTILRKSLAFYYDSLGSFANFVNDVRIEADLRQAVIRLEDLAHFVPAVNQYQETAKVSGTFSGTVADFVLKDLEAYFGSGSTIRGYAAIEGLPDFEKAEFNLSLYNTRIKAIDVKQYVPDKLWADVRQFGTIKTRIDFNGTLDNFRTKGNLDSNLGYVRFDINAQLPNERYKGKLYFKDFDLAAISKNDMLDKITGSAEISGRGFALASLDLNFSGSIESFGYNGYTYRNITIKNGRFANERFDGAFSINDPNVRINFNGLVDLRNKKFDFVANVDTLVLHKLGFTDQVVALSSDIRADFTGLDLNHAQGEVVFLNNNIVLGDKELIFDSAMASTFLLNNGERSLKLRTPFLDANLLGDFGMKDLVQDVQFFYAEAHAGFLQDLSAKRRILARAPSKTGKKYSLMFDAEVKEINPLLELFVDSIYISPNTSLVMFFNAGERAEMTLSMQSDSFAISTFRADEIKLDLFAQETEDDLSLYDLEAELTSSRQWVNELELVNLDMKFYSLEENLFIEGGVAHANSSDSIDLKSYVRFFEGRTEINFPRTEFTVLGTTWENVGGSRSQIILEKNDIRFREINFASGDQRINLEGLLSENGVDTIDLVLERINLDLLTPYINTQLAGALDLQAQVVSSSEDTRVEAYLLTDSVYIENVLIGIVEGESHYITSDQSVAINLDIRRNDIKTLIVKGDYKEKRPKQLDLNVIFDGLDLAILQPFIAETMSDLRGTTIGVIEVTGNPKAPEVVGDALIVDGQFRVNLLGALYTFTDKVLFEGKKLRFNNIRLEDRAHHFAYVSGAVNFDRLDDIKLRIDGKYDNFMVMDLDQYPNALFYGKAFATGKLLIDGSLNDLFIRVDAASEPGTKFYLPIQTAASTENKDYIRFVDFDSDSLDLIVLEAAEDRANETNVRVELNLTLEDDPYAEIILDESTGDIIKGYGMGNLQLIVDTRGDFLMFGEVDITKGSYNFSLAGVVEKKFTVLNGSQITFDGDPLNGRLNIKAAYDVMTSLSPILGNSAQGSNGEVDPQTNIKYPVRVVLYLTGALLQPDLNFSVVFREYPTIVGNVPVGTIVESYNQRLKSNEQLLNQQVFSLIVFRQLAPEGASGIANPASTTTQGSIGELISNQLSSLVSAVDENLQIDVDYTNAEGTDLTAVENFNLRISYQFMDGRLRVSRTGGIGGGDNADAIIGDWTVEYLISVDGSWRAKMYQRQNLNSLSNPGSNAVRGLSLLHTKSFNNFREVFGFLRKKKTRRDIPVPDGEDILDQRKIMTGLREEDSAGI